MRIALTGNPNSGKTTLFNGITGQIQKVGNWAGVTIDKKEGKVKDHLNDSGMDLTVVDLPGAYSMSPYTSEESITSGFVKDENPDAIVNIVDATNLNRSLFFTIQLLELGIPVVVALNKSDLNQKRGDKIDVAKLSGMLGCSVVETSAISDKGFKDLIKAVVDVNGKGQKPALNVGDVDMGDSESVKAADVKRFDFVKSITSKVADRQGDVNKKNLQDKIDSIVAHPWLGLPIFIAIIWMVFKISQEILGTFIADALVGWLEGVQESVGSMIVDSVSPFWYELLINGIIGGVIAVLGFLPLIMVMFFLLALLEDSGYMARAAVVMDRFFKPVGLSGKSVIPMVISTGCAIPGIMATRTIKNLRERRTTAMLTSFMPCGAKLPVIALFAGAFFQDNEWVGRMMYFVAIFIIYVGAYLVTRIMGAKYDKSYFIMELPEYRWPSIGRAFTSMMSRAWSFIVKAGTIILLCNAAVQVMQAFNWQFQMVAEDAADTSILASIASPFAILFIPLGFAAWQLAAAAITGFIAKENVVGTLAVVYGITNFIDVDALEIVEGNEVGVAGVMGLSSLAALSYLMFNLFTPPCFAAIGAMNSEMDSRSWLWAGIGLQFGVGYTVAFLVYQIGSLLTKGAFGQGFIPGAIVVGGFIALTIYLIRRGDAISESKMETRRQMA